MTVGPGDMIKKEDIMKLRDKYYGSLYSDIFQTVDSLLAERDEAVKKAEAYREIAIHNALSSGRKGGVAEWSINVDEEASCLLSKEKKDE